MWEYPDVDKPACLIIRLLFGFDKFNQSTNSETAMLSTLMLVSLTQNELCPGREHLKAVTSLKQSEKCICDMYFSWFPIISCIKSLPLPSWKLVAAPAPGGFVLPTDRSTVILLVYDFALAPISLMFFPQRLPLPSIFPLYFRTK